MITRLYLFYTKLHSDSQALCIAWLPPALIGEREAGAGEGVDGCDWLLLLGAQKMKMYNRSTLGNGYKICLSERGLIQ